MERLRALLQGNLDEVFSFSIPRYGAWGWGSAVVVVVGLGAGVVWAPCVMHPLLSADLVNSRVKLKDRRLGIVFYTLQLGILGYIIGYVMVHKRGYLTGLAAQGVSRLEVSCHLPLPCHPGLHLAGQRGLGPRTCPLPVVPY
jgi:hypothetical protein